MKYYTFLLLFTTALIFSSCNNASTGENATQPDNDGTAKNYTLTPFAASQEFPDAAITSMEYKEGTFNFGIGGESYQLGVQTSDAELKMCANSGEGQHIHLIIDNEPYAAKYTADFEYDIADGEHYLLAFLSRSYHESIKTDGANVAKKITVVNKSIASSEDITEPMLFYSRPKGAYIGKDTEKVMLDFYLKNTSISTEGNKVIAEINGEAHTIDSWMPYYIEGLPMGENTIKLSLVDSEGNLIDTPLNPVTRTFTLQADPAPAN